MSKEPEKFMDELKKTFIMKGVGAPTYHLGADFILRDNGMLSWGSKTYIIKILAQFERLFPNHNYPGKYPHPWNLEITQNSMRLSYWILIRHDYIKASLGCYNGQLH